MTDLTGISKTQRQFVLKILEIMFVKFACTRIVAESRFYETFFNELAKNNYELVNAPGIGEFVKSVWKNYGKIIWKRTLQLSSQMGYCQKNPKNPQINLQNASIEIKDAKTYFARLFNFIRKRQRSKSRLRSRSRKTSSRNKSRGRANSKGILPKNFRIRPNRRNCRNLFCSTENSRKCYRRAALRLHPDKAFVNLKRQKGTVTKRDIVTLQEKFKVLVSCRPFL